MKVLVLSDSHGYVKHLRAALQRESDCKLVFFLGDGLRDIAQVRAAFPECTWMCVRGNNDWDSGTDVDDFAYKYIEGHTVIATHGHSVGVRTTLTPLAAKAADVRADVALYGHTHIPRQEYVGGVLCVNPGALYDGRYAVLDVSKKGVEVEFRRVEANG